MALRGLLFWMGLALFVLRGLLMFPVCRYVGVYGLKVQESLGLWGLGLSSSRAFFGLIKGSLRVC